MTIDAGADAGTFETINGRTGTAVGIERREMPEDVNRPIRPVSEAISVRECGFKGGHLTILSEAGRWLGVLGENGSASCSANDAVADLGGVAINSDHSTSKDAAHGCRSVPPTIVVARGKDLDTGEATQPFEIGLDLSMIAC